MADGEREELPFEGTEAALLLKSALNRAADEQGLSTREAARRIGYKATVVISHMATGRVPIPLDKATDIANVVGLDPRKFFLAVLEQRHPGSLDTLKTGSAGDDTQDAFCRELALIASCPPAELPPEHKRVIREVVADRAPARRWVSLEELPALLALRRLRPDLAEVGISEADLLRIEQALTLA